MTNTYYKAFQFLLSNEGGFSDHKRDSGGKTMNGVSSKYFPEVYQMLMDAEDEVQRHDILFKFYYNEFWNPLYSDIKDEKLAIRLFDLGVNLGVKPSVRLLQSSSNVLGTKLRTDGIFGKGTLIAVNVTNPYNEYIRQVESYYKSLPDFDIFGVGWTNRLHKDIILS